MNLVTRRRFWMATSIVTGCVVLALLAFNAYMFMQPKTSLIEAKSEINLSVLHLTNPGCVIMESNGARLNLRQSKVIPKGTFITGECFAVPKS